jgi:agmatinase
MSTQQVPVGNQFELPYADIPTFGKAPLASPEALDDVDVAVYGVPWDFTASLRAGTRYGPRGIREHSIWLEQVWNPGEARPLFGMEARGERVRERIKMVDCGDATVVPPSIDRTRENIRAVSAAVARRAFPIMLGGDHYVMFPAYQGVCDAYHGQKVGVVQIDAHNDLMDDDVGLGRHWSGTPIRRALEHGSLPPTALAQVGLRGFQGEKELEFQQGGVHVFTVREARKLGLEAVARRAALGVLEHCDVIYLTVDIDSADPSCAPGTCGPNPGGFMGDELAELVRELARFDEIVAIDLVEVAPPLDPTGQTSILAAHVLFGFIEQRFLCSAPVAR